MGENRIIFKKNNVFRILKRNNFVQKERHSHYTSSKLKVLDPDSDHCRYDFYITGVVLNNVLFP